MTGGKDGSSEITTEKKEERMQPKARQKRESGVQRKDMTMSPKNKKGKIMSDFDKYKPWDTEEFSGKIK